MTIALAIALVLPSASALGQPAPRIATLEHADSVAIAVDCQHLLTERRLGALHDGYPLSFTIKVTMLESVPLWADRSIASREASFRVVYRKWDSSYEIVLKDFYGDPFTGKFYSIDDILALLEERFFSAIVPIATLDTSAQYYIESETKYRNMTFDDIQSADKWLRNGYSSGGPAEDSAADRSVGSRLLQLLWDLAGPGSETVTARTDNFRLHQLRSSD
jgi:hypothetical protein